MLGGLFLVHGACAMIALILAIGIYNQKPAIQKYEAPLSALPNPLHAAIPVSLISTLAASHPRVSATPAAPAHKRTYLGIIPHEGGHFFTMWAGDLIHFFGGTLFEVGVPAGLTLWFLRRNGKRLGALTLGWMSVALFNVATYSGDAQKLELNLIGSPSSIEEKMLGHDWYNILTMLGLLEATPLISDLFWSIALIAGLSAIALSGWAIYADHRADAVLDQKLS